MCTSIYHEAVVYGNCMYGKQLTYCAYIYMWRSYHKYMLNPTLHYTTTHVIYSYISYIHSFLFLHIYIHDFICYHFISMLYVYQ